MTGMTITQRNQTEAEEQLVFAEAALALAGHEVTDPALRSILEKAALGELTDTEAIAAIRSHVSV